MVLFVFSKITLKKNNTLPTLADFILSPIHIHHPFNTIQVLSSLRLCGQRELTDLLVLSAASPSLARDGELHFCTEQSHGGGHQHQVGQTLLHYHSRHVCLLGCITGLL